MTLPATEDFTGSDDSQVSSLANWSLVDGDGFDIQGNAAAPDTTANDCADRWDADSFDADQYAEVEITQQQDGNYTGVSVRCSSSAATYYGFYQDGRANQAYVYKVITDSWTQLTRDDSPSVNTVVRLEIEGVDPGTLTLYFDDVEQAAFGTSDSDIDAGYAGLGGYGSIISARCDNWEGGNLGAGETLGIAVISEGASSQYDVLAPMVVG